MNIGVYLHDFTPESGGAFTFENNILESLFKMKIEHQLFIFYYGNNSFPKHTSATFIQLNHINEKKTKRKQIFNKLKKVLGINKKIDSYSSQLNKFINSHKIDIIWFITPASEPVDVPFLFTVWDLQHRLQPFFPEVSVSGWLWEQREDLYKTMLPKAAGIIACNKAGLNEIAYFYNIPRERIHILPHPSPIFLLNDQKDDSILKNYHLPKKYLLYPANFWPHKNHIVILLALKILKEKYKLNFGVVFTGSDKGNLSYIQSKIEELKLQNNIIRLGFVSKDILLKLYTNAFSLVYPSFFGPENMPPLEAFALGCPVIASEVSGAKEQLGNAAILFDPRDENDLARKIKLLYNNKKYRKMLINRGLKRASKWTSDDFVEGIIKIIDDFEPIRRCWSRKEKYIHL